MFVNLLWPSKLIHRGCEQYEKTKERNCQSLAYHFFLRSGYSIYPILLVTHSRVYTSYSVFTMGLFSYPRQRLSYGLYEPLWTSYSFFNQFSVDLKAGCCSPQIYPSISPSQPPSPIRFHRFLCHPSHLSFEPALLSFQLALNSLPLRLDVSLFIMFTSMR